MKSLISKIFFILVLLLFNLQTMAQNPVVVDSLKKELQIFEQKRGSSATGPIDTTKAKILYELSHEYWSGNLDSALLMAEQVLDISTQINYKPGMGSAYSSIGVVHWLLGEYEKALMYNLMALEIRKLTGDKKEIAKSYHNVGLVFDDQGNYPEAMKNYLMALRLNEEINYKEGIALECNVTGIIYLNQKNYKEALKNYMKALEIRKESGDKYNLSESYSNLGGLYYDIGNMDSCIANYNEALRLRLETGDQQGIAISYNNFGDVYVKEKKYNQALASYRQALEINNKIGYRKSVANIYLNMGQVYMLQGRLDEAIKITRDAIDLCLQLGATDYLVNGYEKISSFYAATGNYNQAYAYSMLYKQQSDSLFNSEKMKELMRYQLQYNYDKKHLSDSLQNAQEKSISAMKLQRQRLVSWGGISGLTAVAVLLFFAYRNYVRQKVANRKLKQTQQQLIHQEKLASLGQMTMSIAHEMKNPLNYVNNFSELSRELIQEVNTTIDPQEQKQLLTDLENNIIRIGRHGKHADSIVRGLLAHELTGSHEPKPIDINYLCNEAFLISFTHIRLMNPDFKCDIKKSFENELPLIHAAEHEILKVFINLFNNALYELNDTGINENACITFGTKLNTKGSFREINILITDNGRGMSDDIKSKIFQPFFSTKPIDKGTGLGLSISNDIVQSYGGHINIKSEIGTGTSVEVVLPVV
jgi:two-component system NtrC family sensor kinase